MSVQVTAALVRSCACGAGRTSVGSMTGRCLAAWICSLLAMIVAVTTFFRGGGSGVDGLFVVIALACALVAIQSHQTVFRR